MESQVRSMVSQWPWLIAGALSVSASPALPPRRQPGPAAANPGTTARTEALAESVGGGRWLDDVDLLLVLIPAETATLGDHPAAFSSAACLASSFRPDEPLLVPGPSGTCDGEDR